VGRRGSESISVRVLIAAALLSIVWACSPVERSQSQEAALAARDVFADLPQDYRYAPPRPGIEDQLRSGLEETGGGEIIEDFSVRNVEFGSAPVATVLVAIFNDRATSADRMGIVTGMEEQSGVKAQAVNLEGTPTIYIDGEAKAFAYIREGYFIAVFGQNREKLRTISTALVSDAP
jgi:hypothetical protein